jgi:hypothetical protein
MTKIEAKLEYVLEAIGAEADPQNPEQLTTKLSELINLSGHVAHIVSETEKVYKYALLDAYTKLEKEESRPPSTVHSKVLEAMVAKESAAHTYADKINASLKMAIDGLRTMISLYKTETENSTR